MKRFSIFRVLRRLYDWVLSLSGSPYGTWALFLIAFAESSFFPIPPDILLIALAAGAPPKAFRFSLVCTAGSVLGGAFGYLIGFEFYERIGRPIIGFYGGEALYLEVQRLYNDWDAIAVAVAGLTPIPYKVFTIAAGAFKVDFMTFLLASLFSRGLRFFALGGLIYWFGPGIRDVIDRNFNLCTVLFAVLLVGGFLFLKYAI